jgi:hypothetical protein
MRKNKKKFVYSNTFFSEMKMANKLNELCDERQISLSALLREIVAEYFERLEKGENK